jgi:hypothetical protein
MICVMDDTFGMQHGLTDGCPCRAFATGYADLAATEPSADPRVQLLPRRAQPHRRPLPVDDFSARSARDFSQSRPYLQSPVFGTEVKNIAILISLVSQFTAVEIVTRLPRRTSS